ncbi:hypothetical protein [Gemmata sp.]|uniref:hypothetical protein n=1 Tax=Gemmata sp. TaxID=1914242 RepID=UPI003F718FAF
MDQTPLVDRDIGAGRRLIEALDRAGVPLTAALWKYIPEERDWRLVLASSWVRERGPRKAYEAVQELLRTDGIDLALHRVSVVESDDHLVTELRIFAGTDGAPFVGGTFLHGAMVGDAFVDAAYVYRAERIIGQSGTVNLTAATHDRARKVWVARLAKVTVDKGFFKTIEVEGFDWPQMQTRDGINAHLGVLTNVSHRADATLGDVERWTIRGGRLRGVDTVAKGVRVENAPAAPRAAEQTPA